MVDLRRVGPALVAAVLFCGCQLPKARSRAVEPRADYIRNNAFSLLHQLFDDEKNISKLRFVRAERLDIKDLTKEIAAASKAGEQKLEEFAKRDPSLRLDDIDLPPGEAATRDLISKTKEKDLLTLKGREFDMALLLTQTEALNYARHLAKVAAAYDSNPDRARALTDLSRQMEDLYRRVFDLVLAEPKSPQ